MITEFLQTGPEKARATVVLAHGAGAPMDSPAMDAIAQALAQHALRVVRFEFAYMAARRSGGTRRPPPRADKLIPEYHTVLDALSSNGPLIIGGKSMGGRVASMIADDLYDKGCIAGLLCVGYPFHPPNKPDKVRTEHLANLRTPTRIFQGTRDPFGTFEEVSGYALSDAIQLHWLEDGDHDLKPRKRISGFTQNDHFQRMADVVSMNLECLGW